jgi:hypothetical protein
MNRSARFLPSALFGLAFAAGSARAAVDSIAVDAKSPASPATLDGRTAADPWDEINSVEITFRYNLDSAVTGYVSISSGVAPNPSHTGVETVFPISKDGKGTGTKRFSVLCEGKIADYEIRRLRVALMTTGPVGSVTLATKFVDVDYTFQCPAKPRVRAESPAAAPPKGPAPASPTVASPAVKSAVPSPTVARPAARPAVSSPAVESPAVAAPAAAPAAAQAVKPASDKRPNIAPAALLLNIWGSDPAKIHKVDSNATVKLTAAESITPNQGDGPCAFNVEYYERETNGVATGPFRNRITSDDDVRATNGPDALSASELRAVRTQPLLDTGAHGLKLVLDAEGNVSETNEGDNSLSIRYVLAGRCGPAATPAAGAN